MERTLLVILVILVWLGLLWSMRWGWRNRMARQGGDIGEFPVVPTDLGVQLLGPLTGLYVGSTVAPSWQDRIAVGDIGHRAVGELTRWERGILLDRVGASPIWIPAPAVRAVRTERGLAGKVMTRDGLLVIRWRLPSGIEIDTGFRGDDRTLYRQWVDADDDTEGEVDR